MKTQFQTLPNGNVVLSFDHPIYGDRVTREFMCPVNGGYVKYWDGKDWKQICDGLMSSGNTLRSPSRDQLPALLRREYRKMVNRHRREMA